MKLICDLPILSIRETARIQEKICMQPMRMATISALWEPLLGKVSTTGSRWYCLAHSQIGSTATPFFLTTDAAEGTWDLWFPGQSGCYYTNVNTTKKLWTALWMPTLNVSGIDGGITMEYKRDQESMAGHIYCYRSRHYQYSDEWNR